MIPSFNSSARRFQLSLLLTLLLKFLFNIPAIDNGSTILSLKLYSLSQPVLPRYFLLYNNPHLTLVVSLLPSHISIHHR